MPPPLDAAAARALSAAVDGVDVCAPAPVSEAMLIAASRSLEQRADVLTAIAADFEQRIARTPLPEAFAAAGESPLVVTVMGTQ